GQRIGDHVFYGGKPAMENAPDLLSQFAGAKSAKPTAATPQQEDDLLATWAKKAAPPAVAAPAVTAAVPAQAATATTDPASPGAAAAQWLSEHQGDTLTDKAARLGI